MELSICSLLHGSLNHINGASSRTVEVSFEIPSLGDAVSVISLDFADRR